ncbi:MAG: membrane protein [Actinomycetota bacterium]|nr:MAG: membrane protein [Actinomycetota bacterium]|tara:strand:+ start:2222 stop:2809 length:588 start_codon:yes stop_codon:yes gene_type:complete
MPRKPRQVFQVIFGTSLIGVGISLNYLANLGLGPWGVFHDGLSKTIGITYGRTIIVTGVAVMLLWIPLKQKPGLGTLIDIFLVGLVADTIILYFEFSENIFLSLILILLGIISIGTGTAIYVGADLGVGPRDGIMVGLETLGIKIGTARNLIELIAFLTGWLLGGLVGYVTILFVIGIGPVVQLVLPYVDMRDSI